MKDLYIVGAGGCGRETLVLLQDINRIQGPQWNIRGFLDDTEDPLRGKECDVGVAGSIQDYSPRPNDVLVMAVADPADKKMLAEMLKTRGAHFVSAIHPYAYMGQHCNIGEGVLVQSGFGMTVNVTVGSFVTLLSACVGHDVSIGDYTTISSHCNISGNVSIGDEVFMGGNVAVAPRLNIGRQSYLCMGSVVLKDVPPSVKVLGNPAREIGMASTN